MMTIGLVVGKSEPGRGLPPACRRFGPARTVNRPVNLLLRAPAQMG
jgi:hypothetical protein